MYRLSVATRLILSLSLVVGANAPARGLGAEGWLTQPERDFFAAQGLQGKVAGKDIARPENLKALPEIAQRAPSPLQQRIQTIADGRKKMEFYPEEIEQFTANAKKVGLALQEQGRKAAGDLLVGENTKDYGTKMVKVLLEQKVLQESWMLHTAFLERKLKARAEEDATFRKITDDLQRRSGKARSADDLILKVAAEDAALHLVGKVGSATIESPVLQIVMHKKQLKPGDLEKLNQWIGDVMPGTDAIKKEIDANKEAKKCAEALGDAQERELNLPMVLYLVLPNLPPRSDVDIELTIDKRDVAEVSRVDLHVWTGEGSFTRENLKGLQDAQALAEEQAQELKNPRTRPRTPKAADVAKDRPARTRPERTPREPQRRSGEPAMERKGGFGSKETPAADRKSKTADSRDEMRAKAQKDARAEELALTSLNAAKKAIAGKDTRLARGLLERAIAAAPESSAAKQAQKLLGKLGKE